MVSHSVQFCEVQVRKNKFGGFVFFVVRRVAATQYTIVLHKEMAFEFVIEAVELRDWESVL